MGRLAITVLALFFIGGCFQDTWTGHVYPNKNNLEKSIGIGTFNSLEECRDAAIGKLKSMNAMSRGDYECGKNCKQSDYGVLICDETLK